MLRLVPLLTLALLCWSLARAQQANVVNLPPNVPLVYDPMTYGAKCDSNGTTGTDDSTAINAMFTAIKAANAPFQVTAPGKRTCFVSSTIVVTDLGKNGSASDKATPGSTITLRLDCATNGTPCVNALGSRWINWDYLYINGETTNAPSCGIQIGLDAASSADLHYFHRPFIIGYYAGTTSGPGCPATAYYNVGSETVTLDDPFINNHYLGGPAYGVVLDGINHWGVTGLAVDTATSFNEPHTQLGGSIITNSTLGAPVWIAAARRTAFSRGAYAAATAGANCVQIYSLANSPIRQPFFDMHCETSGLTDTFRITGTNGNAILNGITEIDHDAGGTNSIFKADTSWGSNVLTGSSWAGGQVTFTTTTAHGVVPDETFVVTGSTPSGYNGTYLALAGTTGSTLVAALVTNPGAISVEGTLSAGGITAVAANDMTVKIDHMTSGNGVKLFDNTALWTVSINAELPNAGNWTVPATLNGGTVCILTACTNYSDTSNSVTLLSAGLTVVPTVTAGGASYVNGDTITLADGCTGVVTFGGASVTQSHTVLTVTNASGGVIQAAGVSITTAGKCVSPPLNPIAQGTTSGVGTGATFTASNVGWTGTFTPTKTLIHVRIIGGGSGGGCVAASSGAAGGPGMAGTYIAADMQVTIGTPLSYSIGWGGPICAGSANGGAGANTVFNTLVAQAGIQGLGSASGVAGAASNANLNARLAVQPGALAGQITSELVSLSNGGIATNGIAGMNSPWGTGGSAGASTNAGSATGYGAGGGAPASTGSAELGGAGSGGAGMVLQ